jgi:hypothetical protein
MADRPDDVFIHAEVSMEELRRKRKKLPPSARFLLDKQANK